jgi:Ion channel
MLVNFAAASFMVGLTVTIHFGGALVLMWLLSSHGHRFHARDSVAGRGAAVLFIVFGLVIIHTLEIWAYAMAYLVVGALGDLETALYFSTTTFTTLGYGDVVLDRRWRLFGAIEGANGLLLFGWSTAFLFTMLAQMRSLERDWLERH